MFDTDELIRFCKNWRKELEEEETICLKLAGTELGEACRRFGFQMDGGRAIREGYPGVLDCPAVLERCVKETHSIALLGSGIYSQWNDYSHRESNPCPLPCAEVREWFQTAFRLLLKLAEQARGVFEGVPKKMRLESRENLFCPGGDEEIGQVFILRDDGTVTFRTYALPFAERKKKTLRKETVRLSKEDAGRLLDHVITYFQQHPFEENYVLDGGMWDMKLTNTEGKSFLMNRSLVGGETLPDGTDLSGRIREVTGIRDMLLFSGEIPKDVITGISVTYLRTRRGSDEEDDSPVREQIKIDRKTECVNLFKSGQNGETISACLELPGKIVPFLDVCEAESFFSAVPKHGEHEAENGFECPEYTITIEYLQAESHTICGSFDRRNLPEEYARFAHLLNRLLRNCYACEFLDPDRYRKAGRLEQEYIYCSVSFPGSRKTYYYLCDRDSVKAGDPVLVPTGPDQVLQEGTVENVEYFDAAHVPYPVQKTKKLLF